MTSLLRYRALQENTRGTRINATALFVELTAPIDQTPASVLTHSQDPIIIERQQAYPRSYLPLPQSGLLSQGTDAFVGGSGSESRLGQDQDKDKDRDQDRDLDLDHPSIISRLEDSRSTVCEGHRVKSASRSRNVVGLVNSDDRRTLSCSRRSLPSWTCLRSRALCPPTRSLCSLLSFGLSAVSNLYWHSFNWAAWGGVDNMESLSRSFHSLYRTRSMEVRRIQDSYLACIRSVS
jgi:hypothetical protein